MLTTNDAVAETSNPNGSTGPKTEEGKLNSRNNACSHSMAGSGPVVIAKLGVPFFVKFGDYSRIFPTSNAYQVDLLLEIVFQELRKQHCREVEYAVMTEIEDRARDCWHDDRTAEVEELADNLHYRPGPVAAQLRTTLHGRRMVETCWRELIEVMNQQDIWDEYQLSFALDLIGCDSPIRPVTRYATRQAQLDLATSQHAELVATHAKYAKLDAAERERTIYGTGAVLNKKLRLTRRYLKEAESRGDRAMAAYRASRAGEPAPADAEKLVSQSKSAIQEGSDPCVGAAPKVKLKAPPREVPPSAPSRLATASLREVAESVMNRLKSNQGMTSGGEDFVSEELEDLREFESKLQVFCSNVDQALLEKVRAAGSEAAVELENGSDVAATAVTTA